MEKKNIIPQNGKPVIRTTAGQLPSHLAELSEEALGGAGVEASQCIICPCICSYDDGVGASQCIICPCICSYDGDDA